MPHDSVDRSFAVPDCFYRTVRAGNRFEIATQCPGGSAMKRVDDSGLSHELNFMRCRFVAFHLLKCATKRLDNELHPSTDTDHRPALFHRQGEQLSLCSVPAGSWRAHLCRIVTTGEDQAVAIERRDLIQSQISVIG